tara:strand:+ start:66 stop:344 length:279 start_codon:yes stop_codon:yes gene_type:complete
VDGTIIIKATSLTARRFYVNPFFPLTFLWDLCHNSLLINNNEVNMEEQDYTHTIWIECVDQYQADLVLKVLKENLTPDYYESLRKGIHFNDN